MFRFNFRFNFDDTVQKPVLFDDPDWFGEVQARCFFYLSDLRDEAQSVGDISSLSPIFEPRPRYTTDIIHPESHQPLG